MVRACVNVCVLLAVLLGGFQGAVAAFAPAMAMSADDPCCPDCDRPAQPSGCEPSWTCLARCGAMAAAVVPPSPTPPRVLSSKRQRPAPQPWLASLGSTPPLRPPR